jgi:fatty-acid desaturase
LSTTNSGFTVTHSVLVVFQPSMPIGSKVVIQTLFISVTGSMGIGAGVYKMH